MTKHTPDLLEALQAVLNEYEYQLEKGMINSERCHHSTYSASTRAMKIRIEKAKKAIQKATE